MTKAHTMIYYAGNNRKSMAFLFGIIFRTGKREPTTSPRALGLDYGCPPAGNSFISHWLWRWSQRVRLIHCQAMWSIGIRKLASILLIWENFRVAFTISSHSAFVLHNLRISQFCGMFVQAAACVIGRQLTTQQECQSSAGSNSNATRQRKFREFGQWGKFRADAAA